ncbi:MAG: hypothetical protein Q4G02_00415 [bacterium]|nr:hypothetical protein [bacterium]
MSMTANELRYGERYLTADEAEYNQLLALDQKEITNLTQAVGLYQKKLENLSQVVADLDLKGPFVGLQNVFADENFQGNTQIFLKFLQEDLPVATQVATPYLQQLDETCAHFTQTLDALFVSFTGGVGNLLLSLQEILPQLLAFINSQWEILIADCDFSATTMIAAVSELLTILGNSLTVFGNLATALWRGLWQGLSSVCQSGAANIINYVSGLVNGVIDKINSLLAFVNEVGGKIGLDLNWQIPKFQNGGYVPKTGLALVHAGEFVLSKAMLSGQQAVPNTIVNRNNQAQITVNATVNRSEQLEALIQRLGWLAGSPSY